MFIWKQAIIFHSLLCSCFHFCSQSQTFDLSGHYQHRPRMTVCQDLGKDAKKKKGWADWTKCEHILAIYWKCGHLEKQVCCYDALAWILKSNPDLGGGMNGWLKRLSLVALCQCQLCSEVEIVGEGICRRCFQVLTEEEVARAIWETNIQGK